MCTATDTLPTTTAVAMDASAVVVAQDCSGVQAPVCEGDKLSTLLCLVQNLEVQIVVCDTPELSTAKLLVVTRPEEIILGIIWE